MYCIRSHFGCLVFFSHLVAMAQQRGWGQAQKNWPSHDDWGHAAWSSSSSGWDRRESRELSSPGNQSFPSGTPEWTPSLDNLRICYQPVTVRPTILRSSKKAESNAWEHDRWTQRVEELNTTKEVSLNDVAREREFQSNYGKQKAMRHLVSPTPLDYQPGQGSRLYPADECYFENYEFAPWELFFSPGMIKR
jgi:hypothetical protein